MKKYDDKLTMKALYELYGKETVEQALFYVGSNIDALKTELWELTGVNYNVNKYIKNELLNKGDE